MKEKLREHLDAALRALLLEHGPEGGEPPAFALEVPRQPEHGDFACNAAMLLGKRLKVPPRQIAERLAALLGDADGLLSGVEVAGPGFLNLRLAGTGWHEVLRGVLTAGARYGRSDAGRGRSVQVEFVSANPTGPLTLGHGRNAVLGDSIARLLDATGWAVTREYYFNDAGRQMRVLGQSVRARYLEQLGKAAPPTEEMLDDEKQVEWPDAIDGLPVVFPKDGYQGEYIQDIAESLRVDHGEGLLDEPAEGRFRDVAQTRIFAEIKTTLAALEIDFDVYTCETDLYKGGQVETAIADLRERDLVYEADGAVWLRATALGLDRDRVLIKSSGEATYLTPDIAYHRAKFARGFERVIDVQGADHIEQFPFVQQAVAALGCDPERIELAMYQFVTLTQAGVQVKQSTRKATYVTVDELLADVGRDVFRFFMIQRRAEGHLDFDLDLAKDTDWKKNPAYSVQYAHARACSIERKAREAGVALPAADGFDAERLSLPEELELVRTLGAYPELVERAAASCEPHHVAYYLREVGGMWNSYLQDGGRHRVLSEDAGLTKARLALVGAVRTVLRNGLGLIGLTAPEQM